MKQSWKFRGEEVKYVSFQKNTVYVFDAVMSKCGHEQHLKKKNNHTGWQSFFCFFCCCFFKWNAPREKNIPNHPCLSVEWEDDERENIVQRQQRNCVYDRRRTEKTQHSGMLLLCFKSLCERLSGQLCVETTSLGYTHKAYTGPPNGCSHIYVIVFVTSNLSRM